MWSHKTHRGLCTHAKWQVIIMTQGVTNLNTLSMATKHEIGEQRIIRVNTMGPQQGTTTANVTLLLSFCSKTEWYQSCYISLLVLVAAMCTACTERTKPEWRSPAAKGATKRYYNNNNNVLFLHIGAHSPPQSKEQNSQNKLWRARTHT